MPQQKASRAKDITGRKASQTSQNDKVDNHSRNSARPKQSASSHRSGQEVDAPQSSANVSQRRDPDALFGADHQYPPMPPRRNSDEPLPGGQDSSHDRERVSHRGVANGNNSKRSSPGLAGSVHSPISSKPSIDSHASNPRTMNHLRVRPGPVQQVLAQPQNLQPLLDKFIGLVAASDGEGCAIFVNDNQTLINGTHLIRSLRAGAAQSLTRGEVKLAEKYINAIAVAHICRNEQSEDAHRTTDATQLFVSMEVTQRHRRICEGEKLQLDKMLNQNRGRNGRVLESQDAQDDKKRKDLEHESDESRKLLRTTPSHSLRNSFRRRPTGFFVPGRLFALVLHEALPGPMLSATALYGKGSPPRPNIVSNIAYLISVKTDVDFCLALRAKSYGNRGVPKQSKTADAHAIIYISDAPKQCEGEAKLGKRPIRIQAAEGGGQLPPTMRLDFGRVYTVEFTSPAMEVGEVAQDSRGWLDYYWREHVMADHTPAPSKSVERLL